MKFPTEHWPAIAALFHELQPLAPAARQAQLAAVPVGVADAVAGLLAAAAAKDDFVDHGAMQALHGRDAMLGRQFGPFELLERMAEGGMGAIYRARRADGSYDQDVAVKVLRQGLASAAMRERFVRERQTLARLQHPHVARLLGGGTTADGLPFLAMELVHGLPIDRWCAETAASLSHRVALFTRVCGAVQFVHQHLVVHLDLKPGNILVDEAGEPKLVDFGVAALLDGDGSVAVTRGRPLTPEYASPEQLRGEPLGTAADVFALGVVLADLLADELPRERDLQRVVAKARAAAADERYASCQALADDLQRWLQGFPVLAAPPTLGGRLHKFVRRNPLAVASGLTLVAAIVTVAIASLGIAAAARRERDVAEVAQRRIGDNLAHARVEAKAANAFATFLADAALSDHEAADPQFRASLLASILRESERVRRRWVGDPHLRATMLDALGDGCARLGDLVAAESLLREAAAIRAASIAGPDLEHALSLGSLGRLRFRQGRFEDAAMLFRQAYDLHKSCPPEVHTDVAGAANDLATAERACGRRSMARELLHEALALRRAAADLDEAPLAETLNNLAGCEDDLLRAEELLVEALAIRSRVLGDHDPLTLQLHVNLARAAIARGDHAAAVPRLRLAIEASRSLGDRGRELLAQALSSTAVVQMTAGDYEAALAAADEAVQIDRLVHGPMHPRVASHHDLRATILGRLGDHEPAVAAASESVRIRKTMLPAGHRDIGRALCGLGGALTAAGRAAEGIVVLDEARALHERSQPASAIDRGDVWFHLAIAQEQLLRFDDAERSILAAIELYADIAERRSTWLDLHRWAAEFYGRRGRQHEASRHAAAVSHGAQDR